VGGSDQTVRGQTARWRPDSPHFERMEPAKSNLPTILAAYPFSLSVSCQKCSDLPSVFGSPKTLSSSALAGCQPHRRNGWFLARSWQVPYLQRSGIMIQSISEARPLSLLAKRLDMPSSLLFLTKSMPLCSSSIGPWSTACTAIPPKLLGSIW
jgi:hypothetical protein